MRLALPEQLFPLSDVLQQYLLPLVAPAGASSSDRTTFFIALRAVVPSARCSQGLVAGTPGKHRLAKSVYGLTHTCQLFETRKTHHSLRYLCGWDLPGRLPHESTFSRPFANGFQ